MVQLKFVLGILIIVLVSGCVNQTERTPITPKNEIPTVEHCINSNEPPSQSFDYSTKLSLEEQKIVGNWMSQSGFTTLVFNADRTGRRIGRGDNGNIVYNESHNWRIENEKIITECFYPTGVIGSSSYQYMIDENNINILTLIDFSGVGKDIIIHRVKTQPQDKIINLNAQQIILNDTEIKGILGTNLTKIEQYITPEKNDDKFGHILSGISVVYGKHEYYIYENATIGLSVSSELGDANKLYQSWVLELQNGTEKIISNKIDIGDYGELYSVVETKKGTTGLSVGESIIIFRKNNIIVLVMTKPDINIETLFELAKKQDEKISRILDMIQ